MEKEDEKRDDAADAGVWDGGLGKRGQEEELMKSQRENVQDHNDEDTM